MNLAAVCSSTVCSFFQVSEKGSDPCRIIQDLTLLLEICQVLESSLESEKVLQPVLKLMASSIGMQNGSITILNRDTGKIIIEETFGLSKEECHNGRSKIMDGPIAKVIQNGQPVVIHDISKSEYFKHRIPSQVNKHAAVDNGSVTSFISVPIKSGNNTVGALSVERCVSFKEGFEHDLRLLSLIASVLVQAVGLRQTARERLQALQVENERLQEQIKNHFKPDNMIGGSSAMRSVFHHIEQVAGSQTTVFIRGESGVGKELVASAIHQNSPRKDKAFVKVNCAALPDSIIESELFGHEKGAFTGAIAMRKGRFEIAHGGTIFLDEIGDLSPPTQVKLLRVLQEREFERVGGQYPIRCNVRVIAATSRNVEQLIEENKFRLDLYYRLNVFPVYVPPLRERKSDILQLADHFVEKYTVAAGKRIRRISTSAIDLMMMYHWPGNVRELENCIERAVLLCRDDAIHAHHLPPTLQAKDPSKPGSKGGLESALNAVEFELVVDALKETQGNMAQAARQLGISERIMGLRIKKHRIDPLRYRAIIPAES
ncbi:MAG: sigma 54-interacting transcriptional regulator [Verrucomicrobiales bacterium]|jgi:Nif-specific regulatory protein|nr:sigma 54-interacting transcriptional regulator [Verrucomicrobiales bacterium]